MWHVRSPPMAHVALMAPGLTSMAFLWMGAARIEGAFILSRSFIRTLCSGEPAAGLVSDCRRVDGGRLGTSRNGSGVEAPRAEGAAPEKRAQNTEQRTEHVTTRPVRGRGSDMNGLGLRHLCWPHRSPLCREVSRRSRRRRRHLSSQRGAGEAERVPHICQHHT